MLANWCCTHLGIMWLKNLWRFVVNTRGLRFFKKWLKQIILFRCALPILGKFGLPFFFFDKVKGGYYLCFHRFKSRDSFVCFWLIYIYIAVPQIWLLLLLLQISFYTEITEAFYHPAANLYVYVCSKPWYSCIE